MHFHSSRLLPALGKGSFSKPCGETLTDKNMLGSLLIIFPAPHDGGVISLRSYNHEWTFDRNREMASAAHGPSVGYRVLPKATEPEVAPITSGCPATLTYNPHAEPH